MIPTTKSTKMEFDKLSRSVIGCAIEVHRTLGPGLLESTYRQCLAYELSEAQIPFQMELPLPVRYKNILLDCGYRIDLLVSADLIVEIKSALAAHDAIPLLVFDEIDTNVGGEIAHAVGAKMQTLGRDHQVICITHLPQVAATASSHFVVTKDVTRGRTFSNLHEVTGKARQEEIARMLGGKSDSALRLAATLLKQT